MGLIWTACRNVTGEEEEEKVHFTSLYFAHSIKLQCIISTHSYTSCFLSGGLIESVATELFCEVSTGDS